MKIFQSQSGFNLVELMVAMVIGVFLIGGALQVYIQSQSALHTSDTTARMQETGRFAISMIEQDVRAVDLWGLTNTPTDIAGRADPTDPIALAVNQSCYQNWALNLELAIEGSNNINPYAATCIPATQYMAGSDVLVVRHADEAEIATADLQAGVLYIRSSENTGRIFAGTTQPTGIGANAINSELVTVAYWVSNRSDNDANTPSLRRSVTSTAAGAVTVVNEEVISGVEDLQVQYGVDLNGNGSVESYLDFDDVADPSQIIVARVWIRVRTDAGEVGFEDDSAYTYADGTFSATVAEAADPTPTGVAPRTAYRRLLLTKTIEIRNRR